jgi:hypothetical protein
MRLAFRLAAFIAIAAPAIVFAQPFDPIPAVDLAKFKPSDFTDDELDVPAGGNNANFAMPYLLAHFKTVADAVSDGTNGKWPRGYIGITVWRGGKDNQPHNARIMENNLALAYFYTLDRPWNVYRGHPGVRQRLEAALEFMMSEPVPRGPQGQFSEYEPKRYGLAPTAFATKFLGQSLVLLHRPGAPKIDADILERTIKMQRDAILFVLTDPAFYAHGKRFTNQYGNVWPGGLAYLQVVPDDAEVREKLYAKFAASDKDFFSPVGFPYEMDGPDWSYNFNTHGSNQRMARFYTKDGAHPMHAQLVEDERKFYEWVSYNAVPLPGENGWLLNRAVETRSSFPSVGLLENNYADEVEIVRAFAPTDAEVAARRKANRERAEKDWPNVAGIDAGEFRAYAPYNFLHREHANQHPTAAQRDAARAKYLPYLARDNFNHQRVDDRRDPHPVYTFVRRPTYYVAFNTGNQKNNQRLGLGLLYHPQMGAVIQSQTGSSTHAWGTRGGDAPTVYEASTIPAAFTVNGNAVTPKVGVRDLPEGDVLAAYDIGPGKKEVQFKGDHIEVRVTHAGAVGERIPLMVLPDDKLTSDAGSATLTRASTSLRIEASGASVQVGENDLRVGPFRVVALRIEGKDKFSYTLRFAPVK